MGRAGGDHRDQRDHTERLFVAYIIAGLQQAQVGAAQCEEPDPLDNVPTIVLPDTRVSPGSPRTCPWPVRMSSGRTSGTDTTPE